MFIEDVHYTPVVDAAEALGTTTTEVKKLIEAAKLSAVHPGPWRTFVRTSDIIAIAGRPNIALVVCKVMHSLRAGTGAANKELDATQIMEMHGMKTDGRKGAAVLERELSAYLPAERVRHGGLFCVPVV